MKPAIVFRVATVLLTASILLAGCNLPAAGLAAYADFRSTKTPFQPDASSDDSTSTIEKGDSAETDAATLWISPALPAALRAQIALPDGQEEVTDRENSSAQIAIAQGETVGQWVYALVAPFPTVVDAVTINDLLSAWQGRASGAFAGLPLLVSPETRTLFSAWWGDPATGAVEVHSASKLLDASWAAQPSWAIVPFEELQPKWKVLAVDGQSPLFKDFEPSEYELSVPIGLSGEGIDITAFNISNRDANKLTTVVITGVTALVRATAYEMNRSGVTYPAEDIGEFMRAADITHISNEVPFWNDCPAPDPVQRNLVFCSDPSYYALLEEVGTDVVELTGDHFNDYGRDAMTYTLDIYDDHNLPYYGGGRNLEEARAPLFIEHNGNRIAFIGCNGKGGGYATAAADYPGAVACDYEYLEQEIARLHDEGYLVITTFQHNEVYTFIPQPGLIRDFGRVAVAGSSIVSGSQAHQSHGMQFTDDDTLITYGLGNLFFDQRGVVENGDSALIARHIFYDNRYISTELFTIIFVDFAKPIFMSPEDRSAFLTTIFGASIFDTQ
ncbi:MAG: hypothetical protein DWG76_01830 [Chloroflexi bacterium]|nr:CapA family protein [Chloroflexota bacterium]MQC26173.1 hypothetical protein [Chloroflexota bacterium]